MKNFLLGVILLLSLLPLMGTLAFDEPVDFYNFENMEFGNQSAISPNGNLVVLYLINRQGSRHTYMQIFTPQNQAVLTEPIMVGTLNVSCIRLLVNADNSIAICRPKAGSNGYSNFIIDTYDSTGNLLPNLSDTIIISRYGLYSTDPYYFMSDGQGGYHFSIRARQSDYCYQHMNANGNLAHPVSGLVLGSGTDEYQFKMLPTTDNGAIITYPYCDSTYQDRIKLSKIGADYQILWQINYPGSEPCPYDIILLNGPGNSLYTVTNSTVLVNRLDSLGNSLWTEEWAPTGVQNPQFISAVSTSTGNLVVQYRHVNPYPLLYTYYQDLINPSGELIIGSQISNPASLMVADHYGGWYVINESPSLSVQYYNSSGQSCPEYAVISANSSGVRINAFIRHEGDNLRVVYSTNNVAQTEIRTQEVDNQENTEYPFPGFLLLSSLQDTAFEVSSVIMPNGAIFAMWRQGSNSFLSPHKIMYNVVTPWDHSSLPAPLCILEEGEHIKRFWLFSVDDGNILICWTRQSGDNYSSYALLLNPSSGSLWGAEGRFLFSGPGEPSFGFYNNSLYMARVEGSQVRLHRFVNGLPMWESNGIMVAQPNPAYSGSTLGFVLVTRNCVTWAQSSNSLYPSMSFMNIFSEDGTLQFPLEGIPLAELSANYLGASIANICLQGSALIMTMKYHYRVWEYDGGPNSSQSWHYYFDRGISVLNADGNLNYNQAFSCVNCYAYCITEDAYYETTYGERPFISKHDFSGNTIWAVRYESNSFITGLYPMADGRIMIISTKINAESDRTNLYAILSANSQIEYPADALFAFGYCPTTYASDFGMFLLINSSSNNYDSYRASVQYFELIPLHNSDPHASLGLISISQNYPNPFRSTTAICLKMPQKTQLMLRVFNIRGQCVKTIYNGNLAKGDNILEWDGKDDHGKACASGVYIFRAETSDACRTVKALILK